MQANNIDETDSTNIIHNLFEESIELDSWLFNYKKPNKISKIQNSLQVNKFTEEKNPSNGRENYGTSTKKAKSPAQVPDEAENPDKLVKEAEQSKLTN